MSVFGKYSSYYDLLYKDKDYKAEADFVYALLKEYQAKASNLLELGCGSGGHAMELAKRDLKIHGVDMSQDMLDMAKTQSSKLPEATASNLRFSKGDIRELALGACFDSVLSLFHVISYLPTLDDIRTVFERVHSHLEKGGVFIFDVWYAPAVLTQKPEVRVKRMRNDQIAVTRIAEPVWHPNECWVDVCYKVFIENIKTGEIEELETEVHRMHYLSLPEINLLAQITNFDVVNYGEWLSGNAPGSDTWGVYFVLRRR